MNDAGIGAFNADTVSRADDCRAGSLHGSDRHVRAGLDAGSGWQRGCGMCLLLRRFMMRVYIAGLCGGMLTGEKNNHADQGSRNRACFIVTE